VSDVTLVVEGREIFAHRTVLAARCPHFKSMLTSGARSSRVHSPTSAQASPVACLAILLRHSRSSARAQACARVATRASSSRTSRVLPGPAPRALRPAPFPQVAGPLQTCFGSPFDAARARTRSRCRGSGSGASRRDAVPFDTCAVLRFGFVCAPLTQAPCAADSKRPAWVRRQRQVWALPSDAPLPVRRRGRSRPSARP
jgi:hypothetical protein